jgi:hypothetical protein
MLRGSDANRSNESFAARRAGRLDTIVVLVVVLAAAALDIGAFASHATAPSAAGRSAQQTALRPVEVAALPTATAMAAQQVAVQPGRVAALRRAAVARAASTGGATAAAPQDSTSRSVAPTTNGAAGSSTPTVQLAKGQPQGTAVSVAGADGASPTHIGPVPSAVANVAASVPRVPSPSAVVGSAKQSSTSAPGASTTAVSVSARQSSTPASIVPGSGSSQVLSLPVVGSTTAAQTITNYVGHATAAQDTSGLSPGTPPFLSALGFTSQPVLAPDGSPITWYWVPPGMSLAQTTGGAPNPYAGSGPVRAAWQTWQAAYPGGTAAEFGQDPAIIALWQQGTPYVPPSSG